MLVATVCVRVEPDVDRMIGYFYRCRDRSEAITLPSACTTRKNNLGEFVLPGRYHSVNFGLLVQYTPLEYHQCSAGRGIETRECL
jgi:hypothetical protein